ncbi:hypothetical protein WN943_004271 [Citrus x changshan-huyou]
MKVRICSLGAPNSAAASQVNNCALVQTATIYIMAGGNFMHRVISYVVNEVIVNGLANRYINLRCRIFFWV